MLLGTSSGLTSYSIAGTRINTRYFVRKQSGFVRCATLRDIKQGTSTEEMKLLIRNLDRSTTKADLLKVFLDQGTVQSCSLVLDKRTGLSKGFAFVEMPKSGEAKAAIKNLNATEIDGKKIRVKKAVPKLTTGAS